MLYWFVPLTARRCDLIPHMVLCVKCQGASDLVENGRFSDCKICDGKGYVIAWESTVADVSDTGVAKKLALEALHGQFAEGKNPEKGVI